MAKRKSPKKSSDREKKWDKIFNALVKLTQNLQQDRLFLEDKIKSFRDVICKMKMEQKVESMKVELFLGLKEREASIYKHRCAMGFSEEKLDEEQNFPKYVSTKLHEQLQYISTEENADDELADFTEWFDYLSQKCVEQKDISADVSNKREGSRNKALQNEVRKLKSEIEKCKSDKNTEISALLAEKNFVWNQLKNMENDLNKDIRKKDDEVKRANEKMQLILNRAEELQISNEKLRTTFAKIESESVQKSEEIFRLRKEIELLKSGSASTSRILRPCRKDSQRGGKDSTSDGGIIKVKKESDSLQTFEKMSRAKPSANKSTGGKAPRKQLLIKGSSSSSKRKAVEVITIPDSPKLFSSSFKVPKLKPSSSPRID